MALSKASKLRRTFRISDTELSLIKSFLQGSVYCWIKNCKGKFFAARDLVGGDNSDWTDTPLDALYKIHANKQTAVEDAAKDLGWILKMVLDEDKRFFESCKLGRVCGYKWTESKENL